MRSALLVCADDIKSHTIIRTLESEYEIWHMGRQRDAMAYLKKHNLDMVVLDLDLLGEDAGILLDAIRKSEVNTLVIGFSKNLERIPLLLAERFDKLIVLL